MILTKISLFVKKSRGDRLSNPSVSRQTTTNALANTIVRPLNSERRAFYLDSPVRHSERRAFYSKRQPRNSDDAV